jgi:hypothetical protein
MTKKADLLAAMEDDLKQFWGAFKGGVRSVPGAVANGVGRLTGLTRHDPPAQPRPIEQWTSPAPAPEPEEPHRP